MFIKEKLNSKRRKLFKTSCFGKWLDLAYFDHEPHMIDYMLQKQCYVNDAHYDMPLIFYIHGRGLHFGRRKFSLITGLRFREVSFSCYSKGDVKFCSRVFPHRVGQNITSLDLIYVIEDEEFFSKLSDEDAVRVCLLLSLEVIFMGRKLVHEFDDTLMRLVDNLEAWNAFPWGEHIWIHLYKQMLNVVSNHKAEHLKGLHMSRNYVPTYTLSGFVWSFKESKPTVDLRPTIGEYLTEWWTFNNEFLKNYIPSTPARTPDHFDSYLNKVVSGRQRKKYSRILTTSIPTVPRSKISMLKDQVITDLNSRIFKLQAIIQVLVRKTNGVLVDKLDFSVEFPNISTNFCDELNKEFIELFESLSSSSGSACSDLDIEEDADELSHLQEYLLEEPFRMKMEADEILLFKEEQKLEEESRLRLEEEAKMMHEEEKMFEVETIYKKI
ncbi:phospholipase-like protein [Tanacetum coccineum]